jgi:hypothetical protein
MVGSAFSFAGIPQSPAGTRAAFARMILVHL